MPKVLTRAQTSPQRFVLIVDPDADSRAFYRELLALEGLDAVEAVDGRDGMTMALINPPALVMTELVLPFVDGYSLCQVLRADAATRGVPIVMITADARDAALRLARSAGADGVLVKPAPVDRILEEVRRLLVSSPPAASHVNGESHRSPASVRCPTCDRPLVHEGTHMGGVRAFREQWDDYTCDRCGDRYQFRHRTRRLSRLA
jgi:DNA-binding response OmpR family regulator